MPVILILLSFPDLGIIPYSHSLKHFSCDRLLIVNNDPRGSPCLEWGNLRTYPPRRHIVKKVFYGALLLLGIGALILGPIRLFQSLGTWRDNAVKAWDEKMTDGDLEAQIRSELSKLEKDIRSYYLKVGDLADKVAENTTRLEQSKEKLKSEKGYLARVSRLLEDRQDSYVVAGRSYTHREIVSEGKARLNRCKKLELQVKNHDKLLSRLRKALDQGKANLARAQEMRQEILAELEVVKARLANARAEKSTLEMSQMLQDNPLSVSTELGKKLAQYKKRARSLEREVEYITNESKGDVIVDWKQDPRADDVEDAIRQYLGDN